MVLPATLGPGVVIVVLVGPAQANLHARATQDDASGVPAAAVDDLGLVDQDLLGRLRTQDLDHLGRELRERDGDPADERHEHAHRLVALHLCLLLICDGKFRFAVTPFPRI